MYYEAFLVILKLYVTYLNKDVLHCLRIKSKLLSLAQETFQGRALADHISSVQNALPYLSTFLSSRKFLVLRTEFRILL